MNTFHGTKNEEIQKFKPITTVPLLGDDLLISHDQLHLAL